jgi:hypothetical protein
MNSTIAARVDVQHRALFDEERTKIVPFSIQPFGYVQHFVPSRMGGHGTEP